MMRHRSQNGYRGRFINGDTLFVTKVNVNHLASLYTDVLGRNRQIAALQEANANDLTAIANIIWNLRITFDQKAADAYQAELNQEETTP